MIPSKTLDRFLCTFANYGWPKSYTRDHYEATAVWLQTHRVFAQMTPKDSPHYRGLVGGCIGTWHDRVRALFDLEEPTRSYTAVDFIAMYGALALTPEEGSEAQGILGGHFVRLRERIVLRDDTRFGLRPDGFLQALRRALEISPKLRKCGNPQCQHPFFIARRSSDRYCSKECGLWGKRKSNLESWRKNWKRWPSTRWRAKGGRKKYLRKGKRQ